MLLALLAIIIIALKQPTSGLSWATQNTASVCKPTWNCSQRLFSMPHARMTFPGSVLTQMRRCSNKVLIESKLLCTRSWKRWMLSQSEQIKRWICCFDGASALCTDQCMLHWWVWSRNDRLENYLVLMGLNTRKFSLLWWPNEMGRCGSFASGADELFCL